MSDGRSTVPQPAPSGAWLGAPSASSPPTLLPCGLAVVVALFWWAALTGLHVRIGARLESLLVPGHLGPLSTAQAGKLFALAGLATLAVSIVLLLLHLPHRRSERRLTWSMARLLGFGGAVYLLLDTLPMLGLVPKGPALVLVAMAEELVQWSVLTGAVLLLARHWLVPPATVDPPGPLGRVPTRHGRLRRGAMTTR